MKSSMIALSIAAMLAFNTANAATAPTTLTPQEAAKVKSHENGSLSTYRARPATKAPATPTPLPTPQEAARIKSHSNTNNNRVSTGSTTVTPAYQPPDMQRVKSVKTPTPVDVLPVDPLVHKPKPPLSGRVKKK